MKKIGTILLACAVFSILLGCSKERDIATTEKAILGHWTLKSDDPADEVIDVFISKDKYTTVDSAGTKKTLDYRVTGSNESENWVEISVEYPENFGTGHMKYEFTAIERNVINYKFDLFNNMSLSSNRADSEKNQALLDLVQSMADEQGKKLEMKMTMIYVDDKVEP